jgi:plastocyanin
MLFRSVLITYCVTRALLAADVTGTIVIERKLTKRKVTPTAELYQRGTPVGLVRDESDPLAWERSHVAVYLEGSFPSTPGPIAPASLSMAQEHRRFVPDLLVVPAGSSVSFPNFDPIFHNVFSLSKPKNFDLGNYPEGQTRKVTFITPGIVFVNCHLHANMAAAIVIAPNRWSTRVESSGSFVLRDVPPGTYTIVAWHKTAGFFRRQVTVTETRGAQVEFVIPLLSPDLDEHGPTASARH